MSVGYDHVDLAACKKRGIPVGHTPNVLTDAVAELTMAILLATARRIHEGTYILENYGWVNQLYVKIQPFSRKKTMAKSKQLHCVLIVGIDAVKTGKWGTWAPLWLCGPTLTGSTVGIVGMGRIGFEVTKRLKPFGVRTFLSYDKFENQAAKDFGIQYVSFDSLLEQSDFVLLTCALTPETKGMMNKAAFSKMKSSAILINTSRGGVVNQDDLYEALSTGQIRAAGLDVTVPEPLPPSDPLAQLSNCLILPHIASATDETRSQMSDLTARNILAALEGKPIPAQVQE